LIAESATLESTVAVIEIRRLMTADASLPPAGTMRPCCSACSPRPACGSAAMVMTK
jgi:hypothetical protein